MLHSVNKAIHSTLIYFFYFYTLKVILAISFHKPFAEEEEEENTSNDLAQTNNETKVRRMLGIPRIVCALNTL